MAARTIARSSSGRLAEYVSMRRRLCRRVGVRTRGDGDVLEAVAVHAHGKGHRTFQGTSTHGDGVPSEPHTSHFHVNVRERGVSDLLEAAAVHAHGTAHHTLQGTSPLEGGVASQLRANQFRVHPECWCAPALFGRLHFPTVEKVHLGDGVWDLHRGGPIGFPQVEFLTLQTEVDHGPALIASAFGVLYWSHFGSTHLCEHLRLWPLTLQVHFVWSRRSQRLP